MNEISNIQMELFQTRKNKSVSQTELDILKDKIKMYEKQLEHKLKEEK